MSKLSLPPLCTISVVSHGQFGLVSNLLADLEPYQKSIGQIIVTLNVPEKIDISIYKNNIRIIKNIRPLGFGENHNNAFRYCSDEFFLVLNPDLNIQKFNFVSYLNTVAKKSIGAVSPVIVDVDGNLEDHVRPFPTPSGFFLRQLDRIVSGLFPDKNWLFREADLDNTRGYWVGGMFMGFRNSVFREIGGFDERYFMYLEDVDICAELLAAGYKIAIDSDNRVTHDARRGSRRNLRLFLIHCASYVRYFKKWTGKTIG
jgi:N-acetylglucosaminyl-diphospho-decaprenol L-rhamnosyltransferase